VRKDVREFIRRLESAGLTVESTPGHYHVLRDGKPLRKQNGALHALQDSDVQRVAGSASVARLESPTPSNLRPYRAIVGQLHAA
jgi:hypothetical protein